MTDQQITDKANQLYIKFSVQDFTTSRGWFIDEEESKNMAIACVDEIIKAMNKLNDKLKALGMWSYCDKVAMDEEIQNQQAIKEKIKQL